MGGVGAVRAPNVCGGHLKCVLTMRWS